MKTISVVLGKRQKIEWEYEVEGTPFTASIPTVNKDDWQIIDNIRNGKYLLTNSKVNLVLFDRILQKEVGISGVYGYNTDHLKAAKEAWIDAVHNVVTGNTKLIVTTNGKQPVEIGLETTRPDWKASMFGARLNAMVENAL